MSCIVVSKLRHIHTTVNLIRGTEWILGLLFRERLERNE
jgi:hypothetical protein